MISLARALADALARPGPATVPFVDVQGDPDRPLTIHAYRAAGHTPDRPVVMVQHGMARNGDEYRDFWIDAADRHGLLILAPTFGEEHWPTPEHYNNGNTLGLTRPRVRWNYATVERVLAAARAAGLTTAPSAHLFGHSAGAQFVHRLVASQGVGPFGPIAQGNAGWYTWPTLDRRWPEGLGGVGLEQADVVRFLAAPLMVLAGDADTETTGPSLPSHPAAIAQGQHRYARAHAFVADGQQQAARLGVPCGWRLVSIPGIGHDGRAMSSVASALWFDGVDAATAAARAPRLAGAL